MTLDEAIEHAKERAIFRDMCGQEHSELANWLEELKELRDKYSKLEKEADWLAEKIVTGFARTPHHCGLTDCLDCKYGGECKNYWREAARKAIKGMK